MPKEEFYFPEGTFAGGFPGRDEFVQEWYGAHLASMNEPRLFRYRGDELTAYRFLRLPTFEAQGGYEPGKVVFHETTPVTISQWRRLERALSGSRFWSLPTSQFETGLDGEQYVVEGYDHNHYHVVDRWSPSGTAYRNLCDRFEELCSEVIEPQK